MSGSYYTFLKIENKYLCNECGRKFCGRVSSVRRHCKKVHNFNVSGRGRSGYKKADEECIGQLRKKKKLNTTLQTHLDKNDFLKCCVGLVVVKNIPFRIFDDKDFFKVLIEPYEKQFGTCVNGRNIVTIVESAYSRIKKSLLNILKNQLVSISVDIASIMDKTNIGINVQYIRNFMLCINTLAVIPLPDKYRATFLKDEILKCLSEFEIDISQLYSITANNDTNIGKVNKLLLELHKDAVACRPIHRMKQEYEGVDTYIPQKLSPVLSSVNCMAHSIQLAANDVIKTLRSKIKDCRSAVKTIRTMVRQTGNYERLPTLDNDTKWLSTFDMMSHLLDLKDSIDAEDMEEENNTVHIDWEFVSDFVYTFGPLASCAKNLLIEEYVVGDFYRDWLVCEIDLEDLSSSTPYADQLHSAMHNRKKCMLDNDAFLAALYLDPRFNYEESLMFSKGQTIRAVTHLINIYHLVIELETAESIDAYDENESNIFLNECASYPADPLGDTPCTSRSVYEKLHQRMNQMKQNNSSSETHQTIKEKLIDLCKRKQYPMETEVLNYWKTLHCDKEIQIMVQIALAVPATQMSVENAFSALSLLLTKLGKKMTDKMTNTVFFTKLNFELLRASNVSLCD